MSDIDKVKPVEDDDTEGNKTQKVEPDDAEGNWRHK